MPLGYTNLAFGPELPAAQGGLGYHVVGDYPVKKGATGAFTYTNMGVNIDADGFAVLAADTATNRFLGWTAGAADATSAASDGDVRVTVKRPLNNLAVLRMTGTNVTNANAGDNLPVYCTATSGTANTFSLDAGAHAVQVGVLVGTVLLSDGTVDPDRGVVDLTIKGVRQTDAV